MRSLVLFLTASLAVHALIAAPVYGPFFGNKKDAEAVFISYVEPAPEALPGKGKVIRAHIPKKTPRQAFFPKRTAIRESAELLTDPQRGKVFHLYFVKLKERIHQGIRRRMGERAGAGSVSLVFVLKSDGALDKISVVDKESSAGTETRAFAVDCVKTSAPFDPFPRELDPARISFRVTIRFSEIAR